ncbi:hypothetical protein EDC04DRAFT_2604112 [Pisolithus marmoratus]|nr:hypothetical protein EDC04DRAFT_2604112 [Pisolithus marmoratus]
MPPGDVMHPLLRSLSVDEIWPVSYLRTNKLYLRKDGRLTYYIVSQDKVLKTRIMWVSEYMDKMELSTSQIPSVHIVPGSRRREDSDLHGTVQICKSLGARLPATYMRMKEKGNDTISYTHRLSLQYGNPTSFAWNTTIFSSIASLLKVPEFSFCSLLTVGAPSLPFANNPDTAAPVNAMHRTKVSWCCMARDTLPAFIATSIHRLERIPYFHVNQRRCPTNGEITNFVQGPEWCLGISLSCQDMSYKLAGAQNGGVRDTGACHAVFYISSIALRDERRGKGGQGPTSGRSGGRRPAISGRSGTSEWEGGDQWMGGMSERKIGDQKVGGLKIDTELNYIANPLYYGSPRNEWG